MLLALPVLAYALIFRLFRTAGRDWRGAALEAATWWAVFLALSTEALSVPRLITREALAIAWLCLCVGCLVCLFLWRRKPLQEAASTPTEAAPLTTADWILLAGAAVIVCLVGLTAVLSPPNTWDAMAYHMSRVVQWMTNRDVSFYPTFYSAQLFLSPWAEYAILHFDLLSGGDRVTNLVEWLSFVGLIVGVSSLAKELGASKRGQLLAALACAAIPEAVLESSGAANTCAGAFWVVVSVYFLLRWRRGQALSDSLGLGAAMGLAILTKGTAYAFLPLMGVACWLMAPPQSRRRIAVRVPLLLLAILVLNGPIFVRNYRFGGSPFGLPSPLGDDPQRTYANSHISLSVAAANTVKNLALHLGLPSDSATQVVERKVIWLLRAMGADPNDPASTYRGGFRMNTMSNHESTAGDPLQLAFVGLACLLLLGEGRRMNRDAALFAAGILLSFVLFCAVFRWQMWNSRYHLPIFALGCTLIGVVLVRHWRPAGVIALGALFVASAFPFALMNTLRPLAPNREDSLLTTARSHLYFTDFHETIAGSYIAAVQAINAGHCRTIGLDGSLQDFDYPLFAMLDPIRTQRTLRYIGVTNFTSSYRRPDAAPPCEVICLRCAAAPQKWSQYRNVGGRASVFGDSVIFSSEGPLPNEAIAIDTAPKTDLPGLLDRMDREVAAIREINLGALDSTVRRASVRWPQKKAALAARLDALYMERVDCWRVRHSADPLRRWGDPAGISDVDYAQAVSAEQVLHSWLDEFPSKMHEIETLAGSLPPSPLSGASLESRR